MIQDIIKWIGTLIAIYEAIIIGYKMIKGKKIKDVIKSAEFYILIAAILLTVCFYFPWRELHYGDQKPKIVYVDRAKFRLTKKQHSNTAKEKPEPILVTISSNLPKQPYHKKALSTASKPTISTPNNGIVSTGENAHNVAGIGNYVGINGNLYLNEEKILKESYLSSLYQQSEDLRKKYNIPKAISVALMNSNEVKIQNQIIKYFLDRGYQNLPIVGSASNNLTKGITVDNLANSNILICVGTLE
jgi:hypothetical protein